MMRTLLLVAMVFWSVPGAVMAQTKEPMIAAIHAQGLQTYIVMLWGYALEPRTDATPWADLIIGDGISEGESPKTTDFTLRLPTAAFVTAPGEIVLLLDGQQEMVLPAEVQGTPGDTVIVPKAKITLEQLKEIGQASRVEVLVNDFRWALSAAQMALVPKLHAGFTSRVALKKLVDEYESRKK